MTILKYKKGDWCPFYEDCDGLNDSHTKLSILFCEKLCNDVCELKKALTITVEDD